MSGSKRPPRNDMHSITYRCNKVKGASFGPTEVVCDKKPRAKSEKNRSGVNTELKHPEILSTTELISAVGHIWNTVAALPTSESKGNSTRYCIDSQKNVTLRSPIVEDVRVVKDNNSYLSVDIDTDSNFSPLVLPKYELLKVTQKLSMSGYSFAQLSSLLGCTKSSNEYREQKGLASLGIPYESKRVHELLSKEPPAEPHSVSVVSNIEDKKTDKICPVRSAEGSNSGDATYLLNNYAIRTPELCSEPVKSKDTLCHDDTKVTMEAEQATSLDSDYFLVPLPDNTADISLPLEPKLSLCSDYHIDLDPHSRRHERFKPQVDNNLVENTREQPPELVAIYNNTRELHSSTCQRSHLLVAKQEHAYAGAFAGIFVSLCLHPVDTVKTVTQSFRADEKPICEIGRSIVSQRGITGLYRGIASNIASSAPISAIYTFTYESVKGSLLPLFSKEYYPLAHCIAGGSASIATSFVFTPSERIKQQMQIGSRYQNCWSALIGIIREGGLPSLYAGWGAVLWRNIPHSVIKFYVYEKLKHLMLSSQNSTQPNTLQTLVCGGMAGSTAALFTTPFDVVKTRFQTQVPGSMSQYCGVFHALKEIGKVEGLKGLYRGLIPRLVMYVSQGALFFASYEIFKRLLSIEPEQFRAQTIQSKEGMLDNQSAA